MGGGGGGTIHIQGVIMWRGGSVSDSCPGFGGIIGLVAGQNEWKAIAIIV